jgi:hypothetical protein
MLLGSYIDQFGLHLIFSISFMTEDAFYQRPLFHIGLSIWE